MGSMNALILCSRIQPHAIRGGGGSLHKRAEVLVEKSDKVA